MKYGYGKQFPGNFDAAIDAVTASLKQQGFGVLTEIDVQSTLKKKLGIDVPGYRILGACNPPFAHKALQAEPDIGLLLPCNVIVCDRPGGVVVSAMLPTVAMGMVDNPKLESVAEKVEALLKKAVDEATS